ncbi:glycosyltransferase [Devosia sp. RR2S18]|uniref:glycosyltransferase n=1 Tax=Devosia rhizosphaerae TaxID=3049774 RepID=UPI00254242A5|nr:glycosyltransferase [Devosia sp. RR2S18]WIJ24018.1 glycosyltransferase [Devosia sp. RR2S18]
MTRILIDLQACQNESRFRGLGRYASNIASEIVRQAEADNVHLLLNDQFDQTLIPLRQRFAAVPQQNLHIVRMLGEAGDVDPQHRWRYSAAALLREAYIEMLAPDVVFIPSFFEGYGDDATLSIGRLATVPTVVAVHDLIPLALPERYLSPDYSRHYHAKLNEISDAAAVITISNYTSSEFLERARYPAERVINASEGAEPEFRPLNLSADARDAVKRRHGIIGRFVFYTGGADPRKNLDRLIEAFARLPLVTRQGRQLVFAGGISAGERQQLEDKARQAGLPPDALKLLGFIPDAELIKLLNICDAFVFPSLYEGFGLPCLEAMQCGAPTIGANASSIPEIIGNPDALFDPRSVDAIRSSLERVLTDAAFRASLIERGKSQAKRFSWASSAEKALTQLRATALPAANPEDWAKTVARLERVEHSLIERVRGLASQFSPPSSADLAEFAQAAAANRTAVENRLRPINVSAQPSWRIEGPFDSSYSLALVNRELGLALDRKGVGASLFASEGPGDYEADATFLRNNADVAALHARNGADRAAEIVSRNMYPPRISDMAGQLNGFSCYAWEETGFPFSYAEGFNEYLQFVTATSEHVRKVMIDAGVSVPATVVGNGVDHWARVVADPSYTIKTAAHTFLHVSSCFPRKGADVLLKSYGEAFTRADDVLLVIKTFQNPHNTIEQQLSELRSANPNYPPVTLIMDDLSDAQLKRLYEQCDTLVAPSRAEGFGLPIAEAMLAGLHVIATGWSGHLDFCTSDNASLIDYSFAAATTHQAGNSISAWAEPNPDHLAELMQEAVAQKRPKKTFDLLSHWSWDDVASRTLEAVRSITTDDLIAEPRLGWVTTFRKRCGIATYSEHLLEGLDIPVLILADDPDEEPDDDPDNVCRCWREGKVDDFSRLMQAVDEFGLDTIVIQFNYAFFDLDQFALLIKRLKDADKTVVVTLHATIDPQHDPNKRLAAIVQSLMRCDRLLVHSVKDLNQLKAHGLIDNVALFPHGVLAAPEVKAKKRLPSDPVRLASYGFFLPNKGLIELIEAARLLKEEGFRFELDLVNAAFPAAVSYQLIEEAHSLVARYNLSDQVRLTTEFLSDAESLKLLSTSEIIVYPYQATAESASGAVRYGLAVGKAVAVTPSPIFDDVSQVVFALPGATPRELADGLKKLAYDLRANTPLVSSVLARAAEWREIHAYPVLGRRLAGTLRGLNRQRLRDVRTGHASSSLPS